MKKNGKKLLEKKTEKKINKYLTLIWVGVVYSPCWFSLNSSKTVKLVTVTLCTIK